MELFAKLNLQDDDQPLLGQRLFAPFLLVLRPAPLQLMLLAWLLYATAERETKQV